MPSLFEVQPADIERLADSQLTDLLRRLLYLEASRRGLSRTHVEVSLNTDAPDEGEDAHLEWEDGPEPSSWFPRRINCFQVKATAMTGAKCAQEVCRRGSTELKERVRQVVEKNGAYVLFYGRSCNPSKAAKLKAAIREAFIKAEVENASTTLIEILDQSKIAEWVNNYLPTVVFVHQAVGRPHALGLASWVDWAGYQENQLTYVADDELSMRIEDLRKHLGRVKHSARIVGLSGVGKTRLAFEVFKPPAQPETDLAQTALSCSVVYLADASNAPSLTSAIQGWRQQGIEGVLVVDECPLQVHNQLVREIGHCDSRLSLLTLDFDPDSKPEGSDPFILLRPLSAEVIEALVRQAQPHLADRESERLARFAQGFPRIAVLLADVSLEEPSRLRHLTDKTLVERLVWGREPPDRAAFQVLSVLSLFEFVGFQGRVSEQKEILAKICAIDPSEFHRLAHRFIRRGILYQRGDYVRVTPRPLALRLAAQWLEDTPVEVTVRLFEGELPERMLDALAGQMRYLDTLPTAQQIVEEVCRRGGPFSSREILDSEVGASVLSTLAEIHREAVVGALEAAFGNQTTTQLREVREGRRHLVWCLEKLCFWSNTFHRAARLLLAFAAAENESWGNNATGTFLHLFYLYLSGTQIPAVERLAVLDHAINKGCGREKEIAIKALGRALKSDQFMRTMGVETQGSGPPAKDWEPASRQDILAYWRDSLDRLKPFAVEDSSLGELAREQIAHALPGLIGYGALDEARDAVETVRDSLGSVWPEAIDALRGLLRVNGEDLPEEIRKSVESLLTLLQPATLEEKLKVLVGRPPFGDLEMPADGKIIDRSEDQARSLAEESAAKPETLGPLMSLVFSGEQRQGFSFGQVLGEKSSSPRQLARVMLEALQTIPAAQRNAIVLVGFVAAVARRDRTLLPEALDDLAKVGTLGDTLVRCTAVIEPTTEDLLRLTRCLESGQLEALDLRPLQFGHVLRHLPPEDVCAFVQNLGIDGAVSAAVAVGILDAYVGQDSERLGSCRELLLKLLTVRGVLSDPLVSQGRLRDDVAEAAILLVNSNLGNKSVALSLLEELLILCRREVVRPHWTTGNLLRILLKVHEKVVWPAIQRTLLEGTWKEQFWLIDLLKRRSGPRSRVDMPDKDQLLPDRLLLDWCSSDSKACRVVAKLCDPLRDTPGTCSYPSWTPLALGILDNFGDRKEVRSELSSNVYSGFWSGSEVPRLDRREEAYRELLSHPRMQVRAWARSEIEWIAERRKTAQKEDEEMELGIW